MPFLRQHTHSHAFARSRSERGQILPLVAVVATLLLMAGLLVFWLGFSSTQSARAQTAADAAALAGEKELVTELQTPARGPDGEYLPATFSRATVCAHAEQDAVANDGHIVSCEAISNTASTVGWDVQVQVRGGAAMPHGSPDAGHRPTASARASADPYSQASPAITTQTTTTPCQPSLGSGTVFSPHGGHYGFFPQAGTNYTFGCEAQVAGALDRLGVALHLHLVGAEGYAAATGSSGAAHACGAASTTRGLPAGLSASVLARYGLSRQSGELELSGDGCGQQTTSVDSHDSQPVDLGNMNVHLVALGGGPAGSLTLSLTGGVGPSALGESAIQVGCQIRRAWQAINAPQQVLYVALLVAHDESDFGQNIGPNRTDPNQSIGVFQQISNDGWGTIPEELDVQSAAEMFFMGGHNPATGQGAEGLMAHYAADPGAPAWSLAQQTQGSGAGADSGGLGNYGAPSNVAAAQEMLSQVTGGACDKS